MPVRTLSSWTNVFMAPGLIWFLPFFLSAMSAFARGEVEL
jgi:hypothetical protein